MSISLEIDETHGVICWSYPPGRQEYEDFIDLFARMHADAKRVHACRSLMIIYARGVDISGFDADSMEGMQQTLEDKREELFGPAPIERTAFVCPDEINKLAIAHFLAHSKGRLSGEFSVFDTREEAECWLGVRTAPDMS